MKLKITISFLLILLFDGYAYSKQKNKYIAPDEHTDYMWTNTDEVYSHAFIEMLDYYIKLNESTAKEPYPYQSKWNCDSSLWVYTDFDQHCGKDLPTGSITYQSSEWGIGVASLAEVSASVIMSMEKLRAAEDMHILVAVKDKKFAKNLADIKEKAWIACGLFFEYNWTADCSINLKSLNI